MALSPLAHEMAIRAVSLYSHYFVKHMLIKKVAEEIPDPKRNIPKGMGLVTTWTFYIALCYSILMISSVAPSMSCPSPQYIIKQLESPVQQPLPSRHIPDQ